ncbi:hypothetical protein LTR70_000211 [Exophiala xenobiotica]|uniref:GET complex, subunit GET2 n=1 Tax=Lithohypha guttulata TaxID=1690604 RepID=A0ABR0KPK6_9EURO|nr:hypothetical protein LTR24_000336 [Lithohypha guttulata]KAK5330889.1 hypothetical protein LTR70_000211 [Exophiala xenobiotica]
MSEETETPAQRQARVRQQKREAKIKASAQDRLDKITQLSGRAPETMRNESPARPSPTQASSTPIPTRSGSVPDPDVVAPTSSMFGQTNDPEQARMQQEYMRALLGGPPRGSAGEGQQEQAGMPGEDDPMVKMMQAMLGNMSGDPSAPGPEGMPFSADDISKLTGMPSFLTNIFLGGKQQAPPTAGELSRKRTWNILRTIIFVLIGLYTVFTIDKAVGAFGQHPPAPATIQNPFTIFLMGELLVSGAKMVLAGQPASQSGIKAWIQSGREIARDGGILVFLVGTYSWWNGYT